MNAVNDGAEAPLIRTNSLSTGPTKDDIVDMLAVDFSFLLYLFEELFSMAFGTLFLATLRRVYLFIGYSFIVRTFSIRSSSLPIEDCQLDNDLLLALQHPALNTFFYFSPTVFIFNLNRKVIGYANAF